MKNDKELNQIIDRMIAGERIILRPDASKEMREKIAAAEKLLACTAEPTPQYRDNLKKRALNLLESQKAPLVTKPEGLRQRLAKFFSTPAVWRAAAITVTVGVITLAAVWAAGLLPFRPEEPPVLGTGTPAIIKVEPAVPGTATFLLGTEVKLDLIMRNVGSNEATIKPFPPEIWISNPLERLPLRIIPAGSGETKLTPSGDAAFTLVWDQRDDSGQPVPAGTYTVSAGNIAVYQGGNAEPSVFDATSVAQINLIPR